MVQNVRFGLSEGWQNDAEKYGIGAIGAFAGFGISSFTAEYVATSFGFSGWKKFGVKALGRALIAVIFGAGSLFVPGMWSFLMFGASAASLGGTFLDVMEIYKMRPEQAGARLALKSGRASEGLVENFKTSGLNVKSGEGSQGAKEVASKEAI